MMYSELVQTIDDAPCEHEAVAPDRFVRISAGNIIAGLVDAVMRGEACVALTGPAGSGKTMATAAIRDELVGRSVRVRSVGRGQADSLRLLDIAAQLLGRPQETLTEDDIVELFETMTAREVAENRSVLIIDNAEVLQPSALEYLRLMAAVAMGAPPQFVFVGRPEFWEVTNRTESAQFKDLITVRWELGRLSADTTRAFIERLIASQDWSMRDAFDAGGLAALMQKSDGLFRRIVALLTHARAIQTVRRGPRLTAGVIEAAAAALDGGETTACGDGGKSANSAAVQTTAAAPKPVPGSAWALLSAPPALPDPPGRPFGGEPFSGAATVDDWGIPAWPFDKLPQESLNRPLSLRRRSYAYALGLMLVLPTAGTVAYRGIPPGAYRTATPVTKLDAPARVAAPAQSAASGAAATSQQLTTPAQADIEAAVATAAQTESGLPTANVANRSAGVVSQAGVSIADTAPEQSAPHGTAPDLTVAAIAMPAAQRATQAGTPPAAPLPATPTQGQVAPSAATSTEPQAPQAAMPPAAPVPAMPTQGLVAAASAATPTEPQAPQAAVPPAPPLPATPMQAAIPPAPPLLAAPMQGQVAASAATLTEPQAPRAVMPQAGQLPAVPVAASATTPTEPQAPPAAMPPAAPVPAMPTQGLVAAASAATPIEPQAPQAAVPPAPPLPATPTQGLVAPSAATSTEPQAPQAAMPPAAPVPSMPTQGLAAAALAATPTEPQAPQAAVPPAPPLPATPTQAAIPPAPPLPAVPMQGPMAASAATPTALQAAMPSAAPAQQQVTAERTMAELYAARGDDMLEIRNLSAARRFYETAANAGSGRAAMALGRTYDPAFLSQMQVIGLRPDPVLAATWYRRAAELGVPEAAAQLRALTTDAAR